MKTYQQSYYNMTAYVPEEDAYVLYNTMHQSMIVLTPKEKAQLDALKTVKGAHSDSNQVEIESDCIQNCISEGFILENPESEPEYLLYQYNKYKFNDRVLELLIMPTMECNFKCGYCFEHDRTGKMTPEVQRAVINFVKDQYENRPFKTLKVSWYGGEPLLAMDVIENLSCKLMAFANEVGVEYWAVLISNSYLATPEVVDKLVKWRVFTDLITIDGMGDVHDCHRCTKSGEPNFDVLMQNVQSMLKAGMAVEPHSVTDRGNLDSCLELAAKLHEDGMTMHCGHLSDFGGGNSDNVTKQFDLLTRSEYARACFDMLMAQNPTVDDFEAEFEPRHIGCGAPIDRYYEIDELGNVYKCGSNINPDAILFNICEPPETRSINRKEITKYCNYNPIEKGSNCRTCSCLPLCQGGCYNKRLHNTNTCHPMKFEGEAYLLGYYRALRDANAE